MINGKSVILNCSRPECNWSQKPGPGRPKSKCPVCGADVSVTKQVIMKAGSFGLTDLYEDEIQDPNIEEVDLSKLEEEFSDDNLKLPSFDSLREIQEIPDAKSAEDEANVPGKRLFRKGGHHKPRYF